MGLLSSLGPAAPADLAPKFAVTLLQAQRTPIGDIDSEQRERHIDRRARSRSPRTRSTTFFDRCSPP
ncbi:MAG: hypothetical protein M3Q48_09840 [Actinomycetota bacterium]|nr:hypothetical protein [Actinomycetota bacterium]